MVILRKKEHFLATYFASVIFFLYLCTVFTYPVFFIIRHTPYVRLTALGEAVMRCWLDILGIDWHAMTGENKDGYHGA